MKKTTFLFIIGLWTIWAHAASLTPGEALDRALGDAPQRVAGTGNVRFNLTLTRSYGDMDAVFVFTRDDGGFILASADDAAPALLGYGDTALPADTAEMAPGFRYWLDFMASRVAAAADNTGRLRVVAAARPQRATIAPLCATRWNQNEPYNLECPAVDGMRSVTGCAATAMAQVMKYHNWPPAGEGAHSYEWNGRTLSIDFSDTRFHWDAMQDVYSYSGTTTGPDMAVAGLMKAAGHSVDMNYSPHASGASSLLIAPALGKYFRYDKALHYLRRDCCNLTRWEEIIYKSLVEDGPVIYNGFGSAGGHSFVCDGYDTDGYFHFNWGWGGISDGYFLLDVLDPGVQGIGGGSYTFNSDQDIIAGIRPDREGTSQWTPVMVCEGNLFIYYSRSRGHVMIENMIYNSGPGDIVAGDIGLRYTPLDAQGEATGEPVYDVYSIDEVLPVFYGYSNMEFDPSDLPDGRYGVELVYRIREEEWCHVMAPNLEYDGYLLEKYGQDVSVYIEGKTVLTVPTLLDGVFPSDLYINDDITVTGTLVNHNNEEYVDYVFAAILTGDNRIVGLGFGTEVRLAPGEAYDYTYKSRGWAPAENYTGGSYYIALAVPKYDYYELLNEPRPIECHGRTKDVKGIPDDGDADMTGEERVYYTPSGVRVAAAPPGEARPALPAGLYVVRTATRAAKVAIR